MIGECQLDAAGHRFDRQLVVLFKKHRPVAFEGQLGKQGPKGIHQLRLTIKVHRVARRRSRLPTDPDCAARSAFLGQIGWFAPFQGFGDQADTFRRCSRRQNEVAQEIQPGADRSRMRLKDPFNVFVRPRMHECRRTHGIGSVVDRAADCHQFINTVRMRPLHRLYEHRPRRYA